MKPQCENLPPTDGSDMFTKRLRASQAAEVMQRKEKTMAGITRFLV